MIKKTFFVFVCIGCAFCGLYAQSADLRQAALEREKLGDRAGAASAYEDWLKANPQSPEFTQVLFHAADIHPDLASSITLLEKFQSVPPEKTTRSAIQGKTATLCEISGDFVKAQKLYDEAYYAAPGEETFASLYRSARLLFELGETQKSEERARLVADQCKNPVTKKRAALLLTRITAAAGNPEEALRVVLRLTEDPADTTDNENIFLFIFTLADSLGRQPERTLALQRLAKDYPDTPEFRLASRSGGQSGAVTPFPTPSALLNPLSPPETPARTEGAAVPATSAPAASPAPAPPPPPPVAIAVQTGSFSVKENAEYMTRDLRKLGFNAEIRETPGRTGAPVYKVVVPLPQGGADESQHTLIRLKEKGVEGFLLF
ncbi:MAG: SPOR domain-containing protein [Spirochaetales bacterium]|nr:SPOR domain-containing protein [Spirochaetales bacterium]